MVKNTLRWFIDSLYEHGRYIVGACPTYGLCRAYRAQSKICAKCVYAMNVCAMRYKNGVLLGQT